MPRYFFHVIDGTDVRDEDGTELPDVYVAQTEAIEADPATAQTELNAAIGELTGKPLADTTIQAAFANIQPTWDPLAGTLNTIAENGVEAGTLAEVPDLNGIYDLTALNKVLVAAGKPPVSSSGLGKE